MNGQKSSEVVYNKDSIIKKTTWYKNGQKKEEGSYNWNEKKNGLWTTWFENGQKSLEMYYKNDEPNLDKDFRKWTEDGKSVDYYDWLQNRLLK